MRAVLVRITQFFLALAPERQIFLRTGGDIRGYVLTTALQVRLAVALTVVALWTGAATAALIVTFVSHSNGSIGRRAILTSEFSQEDGSPRALRALADSTERRHAALAMLVVGASGNRAELEALLPAHIDATASPEGRIDAVRQDQERMIQAAADLAKNRADRLKLAFRLAGLDPTTYAGRNDALGGPLIDARDPRALAAVLDVNEDMARRIGLAASSVTALRDLTEASQSLPLGKPTANGEESSPFGVRIDPFTGKAAFHSGEDFSGAFMTPIYATAPGVISFTGVRSGYGNTIEIDHGHGFKTRYGHLATISVSVGQHVALSQRIGGMGSSGRSTGDHLHYEVWVNGRPQNPSRFLKAGDYVQQTE